MARKSTPEPVPPAPPSPVAYSYIRFSSREQRHGDSLRRQTSAAADWCQRNGVRLDTSLTLHDLGRSAYLGSHRENPDRHALAAFLRLVEEGKVSRGDYLLVESLDRLTREHVRAGLTLLFGLIEKGIRVVQLSPTELVYDEKSDEMSLMLCLVELSRGHRESKRKSDLLGSAWRRKKEKARQDGKLVTKMLPAWLKAEDGRVVLDRDRAAVVRRIFRMAADGHGNGAICKKLNREGVPGFGRGQFWQRSYVNTVLNNRAVLGEYQPYFGRVRSSRKPDGPPIPNYYPAAVEEADWHAARLAVSQRKGKSGRPGSWFGIFSSLLLDARDGGRIHYIYKGPKSAGQVLVPFKADHGLTGSDLVTFPATIFESAVLSELREVHPADVLPRCDQRTDRVVELAGRELELAARVGKIQAAMLDGGEVESAVTVLRKLDEQLANLRAELATARAEAATPLAESWGEVRPLLKMLATDPDREDVRTRLRSAVRRVVSAVWCLFVQAGGVRGGAFKFAAVQLHFHGGGVRSYLVLTRRASRCLKLTGKAWWVKSFKESGVSDSLDLSRRADAAALERVLVRLDPRLYAPAEAVGKNWRPPAIVTKRKKP